ncbi:Sulfite reductase [NADPH] hemoprotein beta-component [Serinicoccus hydrothermalis]|uniref:Sulfite reductase [NADPH] hemoprotein beta-component n=1 Tax=Serinicoccus hydrothermalis TaxID=1758689 RepID=A0A1B1N912_9MICO|nr:assimilatory sulfite reductase (NADPH) hemoprotein subunit [Serinicoccus hydrothermalis]ANS77927.1 Sulfite reductase [NADPH] hemoprotein beta-component [Serinicoccus hydrothermalis]
MTQSQQDAPLIVDGPLSDNERLKRESNFLRGTIEEDLRDQITGGFGPDNFQLIRFHGMYQQDDRDLRSERSQQKLEPLINVMLRARMPGGVITPEQWLVVEDWAEQHTMYGSVRLTTRQTFQYHGVLKPDIKDTHQAINAAGIDSIATAGDVNRNVLCTSNPLESQLHAEVYEWSTRISEHLLPRTRAYVEIFLDGEKAKSTQEPILGSTYLPRKFKTTVSLPPNNEVDVHANDLNFVGIVEDGELVGWNVLVGGGLAMTHGDTATYPRRADDFGFVPLEHTLAVAEHVVTVQRDWGNRVDRKNAKTKYTLDRVGTDVFKAEVERRAGVTFEPSRPYEFTSRGDRFGWVKGHDGNWHLTVFILNGRIKDRPEAPIKTGLRKIAEVHQGDFRLTANQNLVIAGVPPRQKRVIDRLAREHGLVDDTTTPQLRNSMACVSFPTCPLAMAESERFLPGFVEQVEQLLAGHGIPDDHIVLRVSGCPNGCSRAMLAEVGLVGKGPGKYNLHLGGDRIGTRVPKLYRENVSPEVILEELDHLIGLWVSGREEGEGFGDFLIRTGVVAEVKISRTDFHA